MNKNFVQVKEGKTTHGRYIAAISVAFLGFMFIGSLLYGMGMFAIFLLKPEWINAQDLLIKNPTVDLYLAILTTNVIFVLSTWFATKVILKRSLLSIITPKTKVNWKKVFVGFGAFFILIALSQFIDYLINPEDYSLNEITWKQYVWLAIGAILLVPIQTTSEELFFRGILLQWLGKFTKRPFFLALIVGLIFGVMHFSNPEMEHGAIFAGLDYIFAGFMFTYITVRSNSLELSIGAHAANNMFLCLFITMDDTVFGLLPSVFLTTDPKPLVTLIMDIAIFTVFYLIVKRFNETPTEETVEEKEDEDELIS